MRRRAAARPADTPEAVFQQLTLRQQIKGGRYLLLMLALPIALVGIFNYGSMYGLQIAFKDYNILKGVWGSAWVGTEHFARFFRSPVVLKVVRNTIEISLLRLVFGFPMPIVLALLINELNDSVFKRAVQSVSYLPHFLSWIIVAALFTMILSPSRGIVNHIIRLFGGEPIYFLVQAHWFRPVLIASSVWKGIGWGSILYLAALAGVNPMLYEAAIVDGASRVQRMWYISLPSIAPVVTIILILNMGGILNAGFDQIFNMYNPMVFDVADIIDTYVYRAGLISMEYGFSAAVGMFKSVVGLILILVVNAITGRISGTGGTLW